MLMQAVVCAVSTQVKSHLMARQLGFVPAARAAHSHFFLAAPCSCPRAGPIMAHLLADMRAVWQGLVAGLLTAQKLCLAVLASLHA